MALCHLDRSEPGRARSLLLEALDRRDLSEVENTALERDLARCERASERPASRDSAPTPSTGHAG
jgi:hypothetical protein